MNTTSHPTVFVVEDDDAVADSVAALMAALGFPAKLFGDADGFLEFYDGTQRGCLILDIQLSGTSGLELFKMLQERGYNIPTILISGHSDADARQDALQAGALASLDKPFSGQELCALVRSALRD